ncbi:vanadium-dependent haloperoxidase [Algoriphagus sanaruensis]|uniref:Haloperoxidase n=1 Tax=Algoriphagus sanaruensis TaxID=1727163 RepID=A0A142EQN3_9BACT|nr:vanadium-dependent haloperoxidase [Algoriphagus sanaruensis]AMQ57438.1 haloperoxidase [Algoriphagus sanaruensis]
MKKNQFTFILFFLSLSAWAKNPDFNWAKIYSEQLFSITEVMVTDVASPPVAARIYAYTNLAAYLAAKSDGQSSKAPDFLPHSLISKLENPRLEQKLSKEFIGIYAMLLVGEKVMPSGYLLQEKQANLKKWAIKAKILTKKNLEAHLRIAQEIATEVLEIAKKDGYIQLTALTRYTPSEAPGSWYPTPPAYLPAVEPEWRTMKTFFLPNLSDFDPLPMAPFDLNPGSSFRNQLDEVKATVSTLTTEQKLIASFWDCNPFAVEFSGHMAIGIKKISPGGHWIGITGIAAIQSNLDFLETAYIHALVGMTLHDSFVSCWKAKYDTNRIRPETIINEKLDPQWKPLLQTPPFPEYTSGHSVISTASARILTAYFGDNYSFVDTSELYFGLPERGFSSFNQAASEAAISRLYGGIHFRDAIENGVIQGEKIADYILDQTQLKRP